MKGGLTTPDSIAYYESARSDMAEFLPEVYHYVLEVGCAQGNFSSCLNSGAELWGVEMNPCAAEAAKRKMEQVLVGRYTNVAGALPDRYFDLVICNDVIEHMADCDDFLDSIQKKMTPAGYLMGSVPNVRYYRNLWSLVVQKDWKYEDWGILDRTHQRFFTKKSLNRTLCDHGFQIVKLKGSCGNLLVFTNKRPLGYARAAMFGLLTLLSFGFFWDVQYLRFGFLTRLNNQ